MTWRANHFGFCLTLTSEITGFDQPAWFQDTMMREPFRSMQHDHWFRALSAEETEMRDAFSFAAPVPILGRLAEFTFLARYMQTLLWERNAVLKAIAESSRWKKYLL